MDGFIIEHPDFIASVGILEVVHEVEQCYITIGCGQIAFLDIHYLYKPVVRIYTKVAVGYIRVSIDTLLNGGTNCLFKSVNLFV